MKCVVQVAAVLSRRRCSVEWVIIVVHPESRDDDHTPCDATREQSTATGPRSRTRTITQAMNRSRESSVLRQFPAPGCETSPGRRELQQFAVLRTETSPDDSSRCCSGMLARVQTTATNRATSHEERSAALHQHDHIHLHNIDRQCRCTMSTDSSVFSF